MSPSFLVMDLRKIILVKENLELAIFLLAINSLKEFLSRKEIGRNDNLKVGQRSNCQYSLPYFFHSNYSLVKRVESQSLQVRFLQ